MACDQSFDHCIGNSLLIQGPRLDCMKKSLAQIVADNVRAARIAKGMESMRQLAIRADVAPNSIRNLENPDTRAPNHRGDASVRMDVLEKVAQSMGYECWQLMIEKFQPDDPPFDRPITNSEAKAYQEIAKNFKNLPPLKDEE